MNEWPELLAQDLPTTQESVPVPPVPASYMPQILIENVPAGGSGLTQPLATLIAGLLALGAATIAYRGVLRQVRATDLRDDRTVRINALVKASKAIAAMDLALENIQDGDESVKGTDQIRVNLDACILASMKLGLLGLKKSHKLFDQMNDIVREVNRPSDITGEWAMRYHEAQLAVVRAFEDDAAIRKTYFQSWRDRRNGLNLGVTEEGNSIQFTSQIQRITATLDQSGKQAESAGATPSETSSSGEIDSVVPFELISDLNPKAGLEAYGTMIESRLRKRHMLLFGNTARSSVIALERLADQLESVDGDDETLTIAAEIAKLARDARHRDSLDISEENMKLLLTSWPRIRGYLDSPARDSSKPSQSDD
ncbi:hypothetical protein [Rhodococcus erythropolis]|uniref:Uncharacterized protein n=1 Tax=Rhodococcus erythropolis (strain PR4 / NBRC 100887) TaxID=234621 RepID=C0ZXA2_RHOE4|nr:hypothetical protein [Rhodococcus erythropolis]BAH32987.1 hypothetical protein RER_22790 [Rhodococcus erythropolis PR4]